MQQKRSGKKLTNPTPIRLQSGSWRCQVMVHGQRISVVDADPAVAHARALALKAGLIAQERPAVALTVGEAIDRYIDNNGSVLSPATIRGYRKMRKNDFDRLEKTKLSELTQESVQRWVNGLSKEKSPKSVENAHGLLSAVLAVYAPSVRLRTSMPQKRPTEIRIPDVDEIKIILDSASGTVMEIPILLAMWLGLRASEIRGLTWDCIKDNRMHIKQAIVDGADGPCLKGTKTYSGDRWITIPSHIKAVLEAQRREGEYIVTLSGQAMYKRFSRLCEKLGLPHYRFHDLRHTAASIAMAAGVPNSYIQQMMGHKTDNMLKTVYLHTVRSQEDRYSKVIAGAYDKILCAELHTELHTENRNS